MTDHGYGASVQGARRLLVHDESVVMFQRVAQHANHLSFVAHGDRLSDRLQYDARCIELVS